MASASLSAMDSLDSGKREIRGLFSTGQPKDKNALEEFNNCCKLTYRQVKIELLAHAHS
jgi:hypothetical protein